MKVALDAIRNCLEGAVPAILATVAADGTPNVTFLSQVHYVDADHVALTFQFFNKTRDNVLATRRATARVFAPDSRADYDLDLEYLRTETQGPLFERMRAKLAGIASQTGMDQVFRLRGSDIYRVHGVEPAGGAGSCPPVPPPPSHLPALRVACRRLAHCGDLTGLLTGVADALPGLFGVEQGMVLMFDAALGRLYTLASFGYAESGVGSEIPLGAGVIGVAARERTAIRIGYLTHDAAYTRAARDGYHRDGSADPEMAIPLPGLVDPHSQLAVPILDGDRLLGVLYLESTQDMRFDYAAEDALAVFAEVLAARIAGSVEADEPVSAPGLVGDRPKPGRPVAPPLVVRRYAYNDSIFLGDEYLIKGVAGAILWSLLRDHQASGRTEFTNRELRLDPRLRLPGIGDNLEARLILLQRRLSERCASVRMEKTGRGRFRLVVDRPLILQDGVSHET